MAIKNALERLDQQRIDLEDLWSTRKIYLDLFLRFKFFERDALAVSNRPFNLNYLTERKVLFYGKELLIELLYFATTIQYFQ